jgi:alkanesulfonate monooxygenase SsuD/methylene tetrahydromethanopterin reductase-like flavin-dependent oxidoreductase (luciferase family)
MLEQFDPQEVVGYTALAEQHGFSGCMAADHFQPWVPAQGNASFVWSVLAAVGERTAGDMGPGVTCPSFRFHPAIVAQAAATQEAMYPGRSWLGLGTGEALNEHIVPGYWPEAGERSLKMWEAIELINKLFTASLVPVCSANYLPPGTMAADVEEWADGLLISETRPNDWARWQEANGERFAFDPFKGRRFESSPLLYQAAIAGMGIGIGIREILFREFATGSLIQPFPETVPAPCPFYMIWPAGTDAHPDFAAFREWIRKEVSAE